MGTQVDCSPALSLHFLIRKFTSMGSVGRAETTCAKHLTHVKYKMNGGCSELLANRQICSVDKYRASALCQHVPPSGNTAVSKAENNLIFILFSQLSKKTAVNLGSAGTMQSRSECRSPWRVLGKRAESRLPGHRATSTSLCSELLGSPRSVFSLCCRPCCTGTSLLHWEVPPLAETLRVSPSLHTVA